MMKQSDRISRWLVGASLVFITYFTLFPFDFFFGDAPSFGGVIHNFDLNITQTYAIADFPRNLILFVPLGFGLAGMTATKWGRRIWASGLFILTGIGVSLAVETLQTYTLQRFPALGDVVANGSGTAVGVVLFLLIGNQIFQAIGRTAELLKMFFTLRRGAIVYLVYTGLLFLLSFIIQSETRLSNWDDGYFLMIGNEATGDRQWAGQIRQFQLFDRALSEDEVAGLFEGGLAIDKSERGVVGYYDFVGDGEGNFPAVGSSAGSTSTGSVSGASAASAGSATSEGAVFREGLWLRSEAPVSGISGALGESSAFTAVLVAKTDSLDQEGPARLVSISEDAYFRNFTIGQEYQDLVLRVRTPLTGLNGRLPEFVFPNVFDDETFKEIILSYDGADMRLYVGSTAERTDVDLLPSIAVLTKLFPDDVDRLRIYWWNIVVMRLVYSSLVFLPLACLVGKWRKTLTDGGWKRWLWVAAVFVGAAVLWEVALVIGIGGYSLKAGSIVINFLVMVGMLPFF